MGKRVIHFLGSAISKKKTFDWLEMNTFLNFTNIDTVTQIMVIFMFNHLS